LGKGGKKEKRAFVDECQLSHESSNLLFNPFQKIIGGGGKRIKQELGKQSKVKKGKGMIAFPVFLEGLTGVTLSPLLPLEKKF